MNMLFIQDLEMKQDLLVLLHWGKLRWKIAENNN